MATPLKPILDNLYLETFFFFTPWRQVWPNFIKMMGEQAAPGDTIDYSVPTMTGPTPLPSGLIYDYFGLPNGLVFDDVPVSALPFRCYNKIWNFWFRDENLMAPVPEYQFLDTPDASNLYALKSRRKRRDYLTSGLPFPQKGPDVTVNLGGNAPVMGIGIELDRFWRSAASPSS